MYNWVGRMVSVRRWQLVLVLLVWVLPGGLDLAGSAQGVQWSSRIVTTKFGSIRGSLFLPGGPLEGVEVFLGLPYASPPVGPLRLMPPVSGSPWSGTRMNGEPPPNCPQVLPDVSDEALAHMPKGRLIQLRRIVPMLVNQSEDCLYLNVYVPLTVAGGKSGARNLPVLVFVHGESYGWGGGGVYDPSMLASQGNLIVVTINYRLGILGFLNANSDGYFNSPANFALLDQIAALHWVQENIVSFGGDRSNVTLMGHGKGAVLANFLMLSAAVPPGALFQRAVVMSGSSLAPVGAGGGREAARKFARAVDCPTEPPSAMLHCLRQTPLEKFIEYSDWNEFGPSEDGVTINGDFRREAVLRDRLARYPLLWGVVRAESLGSLPDHDASYGIEADRRREVLRAFVEGHFSVHRNEILAAAVHEYTDWERPVQHPISVRDETLDALSDAQVVAPLVRMGELHAQAQSKSYSYVFDYQPKGSDYIQKLGCVAGEELQFVFGAPLFFNLDGAGGARLGFWAGNFTRAEVGISQLVMQYWANFVRTGDPNDGVSEGSEETGRFFGGDKRPKVVEWPSYDPLYKKYLTFDAKPKVRTHYRAHKLSFWLHLVPDLLKNGLNVGAGHHAVHSPLPSNATGDDPGTLATGPPPPPDLQFVGVPTWEQQPSSSKGGSSNSGGTFGKGEAGAQSDSDGDGFQIYSTALSVTIAIGCSLLILNILIFAAFYYQRDKRRCDRQAAEAAANYDPSSGGSLELRGHVRRNENGGLGVTRQQLSDMANICGDLQPSFLQHQGAQGPGQGQGNQGDSDSSDHLVFSGPSAHQSILKRQNRATTTCSSHQQQQQQYDLQMPDAILAAAMANMNYSYQQGQGGSLESSPGGEFRGRTTLQRRSSLTKEQVGGGGPSNQSNQGSKTVPRPPKRSTPNVKFNLGDAPQNNSPGQSQTLKPSLKKYPGGSGQPPQGNPFEDLRV